VICAISCCFTAILSPEEIGKAGVTWKTQGDDVTNTAFPTV